MLNVLVEFAKCLITPKSVNKVQKICQILYIIIKTKTGRSTARVDIRTKHLFIFRVVSLYN